MEISWSGCDGRKILEEDLRRLGRTARVEVAESSLRLLSNTLDEILKGAQAMLRKLEEAGCQPTFKLSARLPSEPAIISPKEWPDAKSRRGRRLRGR